MIFITLSQMFTVAYRIVIYLQQRQRQSRHVLSVKKLNLGGSHPRIHLIGSHPRNLGIFLLEIHPGWITTRKSDPGIQPLNLHLSRWKIFGKCIPSLVKNDVRLKDLWTSPGNLSCRYAEILSPQKNTEAIWILWPFFFVGKLLTLPQNTRVFIGFARTVLGVSPDLFF